MSRAEDYAAGVAEGERWAIYDWHEGRPIFAIADEIRRAVDVCSVDSVRAEAIGNARGYRATVHRIDSGTLTKEMA